MQQPEVVRRMVAVRSTLESQSYAWFFQAKTKLFGAIKAIPGFADNVPISYAELRESFLSMYGEYPTRSVSAVW